MAIDVVGALVGWLVQTVGDYGIRLVRGSPDERALRRALGRAIEAVAVQVDPASREALRWGLQQCFSSPPRLPRDASGSIGDSFRAAIAAQVDELDQLLSIDTDLPFYQDVPVDQGWLLAQVTDAVITALRSVVAQGSLAELVHGLDASDAAAQVDALSRQLTQLTTLAAATRTLPRDIAYYTGRSAEFERLIQPMINSLAPEGVVGIHAIDGMAGIGKTAFAVHTAHQLAAWFPDGQIFLPLHAHTPGQHPVDPSDALATLLLNMGISAKQIPAGIEARGALWRNCLADKKLLLLLDDAAGSEQVRPLLPGTERCLVLVTSRRRLTELDWSVSITLDTLRPDEAAELFVRVAGRSGLNASEGPNLELVQLSGLLPLAIRLVAGQLARHQAWTVEDLRLALAAERNRPASIRGENFTIAAAFDLSYRYLDSEQQNLFRRLGLQFGTDIDDYAAAALSGVDLHTTRRLLNDLYDYHLIDEPTYGRYRFHDLMREYARSAADAEQPRERDAAIGRLLNYYLHTAAIAGRDLAWNTPDTSPPTGHTPAYAPQLSTREQEVSWLEGERANLNAATDYAVRNRGYVAAIGIPFAIHGFLRTNGYWHQALGLHRAALTIARHFNDQSAEASALCQLGAVQRLTGDYRGAMTSQTRALELYRVLSDRVGEGDALTELGTVYWLIDEYPAAISRLNEALGLYHDLDRPQGEGDALCQLSSVQRLTADYPAAITNLTKALGLYRNIHDHLGEADSLRNLGVVQHMAGDLAAATTSLTKALDLYRGLGSRPGQADALRDLGVVQHMAGDLAAATTSLTRALELYRDVGDRHGEAEALNDLGDLLSSSSTVADARSKHESALTTARIINAPLEEARALEGIGNCYLKQGKMDEGSEHLRQALTIYRAIKSPNSGRVETILQDHGH